MNTLQSELAAAFPKQLADIQAQARKAAFDRAAANGERLMLEATQATVVGKLTDALAAVRKDRYACAAYLAKVNGWPLSPKHRGQRSGFSELELMEQFWKEKIAEQRRQQEAAEAEAAAKKAALAAEVKHLRQLAASNGTKTKESEPESAVA